jgi:hypothetical protein
MPIRVSFRSFRLTGILLWLTLLQACQKPPVRGSNSPRAEIIQSGLIDCFEENKKDNKGAPLYCEASAVAFDGTSLIFGSDKPVPGDSLSSVFVIAYHPEDFSRQKVKYFAQPAFRNAVKYEDFTSTPDGQYFLATTAFDRVNTQSANLDGYNTLLWWKKGEEGGVKVVSATQREGVVSSLALREKLARALITPAFPQGPPYFKLEGLACIPGNRLLFGVREWGESFEKFEYAIKIIAVSYQIHQDEFILGNDFSLIYQFTPDSTQLSGQTVALSGLEYDAYTNQLYLLTSYEKSAEPQGLGAFLWTLPLSALNQQQAPALVLNQQRQPLMLAHKAEGIVVIGEGKIFIIHDDDRVLGSEGLRKGGEPFYRKPHQAAYTVLKIDQR